MRLLGGTALQLAGLCRARSATAECSLGVLAAGQETAAVAQHPRADRQQQGVESGGLVTGRGGSGCHVGWPVRGRRMGRRCSWCGR
ncbi:hypothetical protein AQJ64_29140 [Streptomyces griseoruber]|uniref:Uncharacterized protein n=1 Tax=Streptomyces griseoruber TaxID=1943 RepID=A0A101SSG9_9ACTN|nr:hypothetical protein AQJ64_29140 [Streptomyces griseoruber]